MTMRAHNKHGRHYSGDLVEECEKRRLLAGVTLDASTTYQTIQGWGTAPLFPSSVTNAQAGAIMRDAGFNVVRVTAGPGEFTATTGGNLTTPVPISSNLDDNVTKFDVNGMASGEAGLIKWLETNALEPDRVKMIGSLWSPPHWMKVSTGTLMTWNNGTQSGYDPILPYGANGGNTAGGRINPTMYTDWARFVLSDVKAWEKAAGIPMYAFSFQNEPDVQVGYSSMFMNRTPVDPNDPTQGTNTSQWQLYGDALQALATELSSHPEITTKFFGPELEALGPAANNPWFLSQYVSIRQNLISRGLLGSLGGYATHQYQYAKDGDAAVWDAFYNGTAHAAQILSNGTSSVLGWLYPQPGVGGDNKEIWQTETDGEDQSWTKDGAMAFGLKIYDALVYGHVSGYTTWSLTGYSNTDTWGVVALPDINNPTNSYKFDAFKQFSRWIRPRAQRIKAVFDNGQPTTGGANSLDTYNALNVAAFNQAQDKRLTMVFVNMQPTDQSTTISLPANMNFSSLQVYQTSGTQKYVQLADLMPSNGKITLTVPGSAFVTVTGSYSTPTLPAPWHSADIGSPALAGSAGATNGIFTLTGSGGDIWNTSDQFQFTYTTLAGNGSIIARVVDVQNTDPWAKAGVMFRNTLDADSINALMAITPSNGATFQYRSTLNGSSSYSSVGGYTAPYWVRLTRNGSTFTGYRSADGVTWTQVGSATLSMNSTVYVGLALTSHNSNLTTTGTLSGVQIDQAPTVATAASVSANPTNASAANLAVLGADDGGETNLAYTWATVGTPPAAVVFGTNGANTSKNTTATFTAAGSYAFLVTITDGLGGTTTSTVNVQVSLGSFTTAQDIGSPGLTGSLAYNPTAGTYTIAGGGADIWNGSDQFYYASQATSGDVELIARVDSITNTNAWAKAGVMIRESNAANSRFAAVYATPGAGLSFQWRSSTGGSASASTGASGTPPQWVRLSRVGNVFTAWYSSNGSTWSQLGSTQTIAMATTAQAGLAVTSHDNTKSTAASFSSFAIGTPDSAAPTLSSVKSRKIHGSAGTFDVGLSLSTAVAPSVEPRLNGSDLLVLNFNEPIHAADGTLDASEFNLTNASFLSASISANMLTLHLANVAPKARMIVKLVGLTDRFGNALSGTSSVTIRNLYGDVNQTGSVSVSDQQAVKNGLLQTVALNNFLLDVNLSGSITVADQQAVKNALLNSVS